MSAVWLAGTECIGEVWALLAAARLACEERASRGAAPHAHEAPDWGSISAHLEASESLVARVDPCAAELLQARDLPVGLPARLVADAAARLDSIEPGRRPSWFTELRAGVAQSEGMLGLVEG